MWVDSVGLLDFKSSRSLLGLMVSLLSFPSQPVTHGSAHYQLEVAALQPGQLFREQRYALTPRAGHAREVGAPEPARGAEGVVKAAQVVVDVAKRVRLIGVARRAGRLHRDVRIFREREHVRQIRPPLTRARIPPRATEVVEDQLEVWVPLGVHLLQGILFEIGGDLSVPRAGGVARIPQMNLRVDDQHGRLLCWKGRGSPYG